MPKKKKLKPEERSRQQNWSKRRHEAGLCPRCGQEKRDFNQRAGKPYFFGPLCRKKHNAEKKAQMAARRAAGLDAWYNRQMAKRC
jgi:hypothetical protein